MRAGINKCNFLVFFICFFSCSNGNNPTIIKFSTDSTAVVVKNIDKVSLLQLKNLLEADSGLNKYIKVMKVSPSGSITDNPLMLGTIKVVCDSLTFVPMEKFVAGNKYMVESFIGAQFGSVGQMLKGKGQTTVHPQRSILTR
ncbi:hypothetical protein ACVWYG_003286 [Pedobacter sp. UYEF25]